MWNVIIGKPDIDIASFLSSNEKDWIEIEKPATIFTEERFLPRILVDLGIAKSTSEVRKNRKDLMLELTKRNFLEIKWGKKRVFILVFPQERGSLNE